MRKKDKSLDVKLLGKYKELKDRLQKLEEESGYPILGEFWCVDFERYSERD
jgi:hypothetical protein